MLVPSAQAFFFVKKRGYSMNNPFLVLSTSNLMTCFSTLYLTCNMQVISSLLANCKRNEQTPEDGQNSKQAALVMSDQFWIGNIWRQMDVARAARHADLWKENL